MKKSFPLVLSIALLSSLSGCSRRMPQVDLGGLDPGLLERCRESPGVLIVADELFDTYWGGGYDTIRRKLLGEYGGGGTTADPTTRMTVRRTRLLILSPGGGDAARKFYVVHYRESLPPVEARAWMENGEEKPVNVIPSGTRALADWPCELGFPRMSEFTLSTLLPGDLVEIQVPVSGPDILFFRFGSDRFCSANARATFGHPDDEFRPDLAALTVDATREVRLESPPGEYPQVFGLRRLLPPLTEQRLPYVLRAPRCPDWPHLRGRIFHTPLCLSRGGDIAGRGRAHPALVSPVKPGERTRRMAAVAEWMERHFTIEESGLPFWGRWLPDAPAEKAVTKRRGNAGTAAVLAFRILEEAGLSPRLALVLVDPKAPFDRAFPSPAQFDTLAVVVSGDKGEDLWLVPGIKFDLERMPPVEIQRASALVAERWFIERDAAGSCSPANEANFSCQNSTPEPVELRLVDFPKLRPPAPAPEAPGESLGSQPESATPSTVPNP
ncbi:MAG: hypothetical protein GYA21_18980 [Myxococcales bacterium]|nr:hypothetical protein [Myxococcales bacterium]